MMPDNTLVEYLYVDEARLNRYFEQISSPVAYDKVPIWKAALGLTGASAEATQARPGRPFTNHEKVTRFQEYLKKNKLVISHRPEEPFEREFSQDLTDETQLFRIEKMTAQRSRLGFANADKRSSGVNLWVSLKPDSVTKQRHRPVGALFLIEDFAGDEGKSERMSAYSSLILLADEMRSITKQNDEMMLERSKEIEHEFGSDPIGTLSTLGARFGPMRRIQAIYRVRACYYERGAPGYATTTIGYPIVVQAA